jgi:NAD(P)-dependent dehydrogenase (short-subunit alcohol dehydrogenase family)
MNEIAGKICIVTGATSGIGKETARALAAAGATLILPVHTMSRGEIAKTDIIETAKNENIDIIECDLASLESVSRFCEVFKQNHDGLHVLINDAGIWNRKRTNSKDGIEETFAINFLAPFLMTNNLLGMIKRSAPARIINLTSDLSGGIVDFDDIEGKNKFRSMNAYRQSKLEMILFTRELARRLEGTGVTANCLMPGFVRTGLFRNASIFTRGFIKLMTSSPQKGARTPIYLATSPDVSKISGECFKKSRIVETSEYSRSEEPARRLWDVATGYVGKWLKTD